MRILKLAYLNRILGIPDPAPEANRHRRFNDSGRGLFMPEKLLSGDTQCFENEITNEFKKEKKKIIFSAPIFLKQTITYEIYDFLNLLFENYDVYVWAGRDELNSPVTSLTELLKKLNKMPLDSKEEIKKQLALYGLSANEFSILDDRDCHTCIHFFNHETTSLFSYYLPIVYDIIWIDLEDEKKRKTPSQSLNENSKLPVFFILKGNETHSDFESLNLDPKNIKSIIINITDSLFDEKKFKNLLDLLPNLETLQMNGNECLLDFCNSGFFTQHNLPNIKKIIIRMDGVKRKEVTLSIPFDTSATDYSLKFCGDESVTEDGLVKVYLNESSSRLAKLKLDLSNSPHWRGICLGQDCYTTIKECLYLMGFQVSPHAIGEKKQRSSLRELGIAHAYEPIVFQFNEFPNLDIFCCRTKEMHLVGDSQQLNSLVLQVEKLFVETHAFPNLRNFIFECHKKLFISGRIISSFEGMTLSSIFNVPRLRSLKLTLPRLQTNSDGFASYPDLGFSSLENLFIFQETNVKNISLKNLINLRILCLHANFLKGTMDLSSCHQLSALSIKYMVANARDSSLIMTGLSHLEEFSLFSNLPIEGLVGLNDCRNLRDFSHSCTIDSLFPRENRLLYNVLATFPRLEYLRLGYMKVTSDVSFQLSRIRHLVFENSVVEDFNILNSVFPNLEHLYFHGLNYTTSLEALQRISFQHKKSLSIVYFMSLTASDCFVHFEAEGVTYSQSTNSSERTRMQQAPTREVAEPSYLYLPLDFSHDTSALRIATHNEIQYEQVPRVVVSIQKNNRYFPLSELRTDVFDSVTYLNNIIQFQFLNSMKEQIELFGFAREEDYIGCIDGNIPPGREFPIPSFSPLKIGDLHALEMVSEGEDRNSEIQISYDSGKEAFSFVLSREFKGKIFYRYKENEEYHLPLSSASQFVKPRIPFEKKLKQDLIPKLQQIEGISFLFSTEISQQEKMHKLIQYCSTFSEGMLPFHSDQIDSLCEMIRDKKGNCEVRSQILMLLAHCFDLAEVCCVRNHVHVYVQITVLEEGQRVKRKVSLGGLGHIYQNYPYNLPRDNRRPLLHETSVIPSSVPNEIMLNEADLVLKKLTQSTQLNTWSDLKDAPKALAVLIEIPESFSGWNVVAHFVKHKFELNINENNNIIYIDNPSDFKNLFFSFEIKNGRHTYVKGPLYHCVTQAQDAVVFVNWTSFSGATSYMSVADAQPNLFGTLFSEKIRVIGLTHSGSHTCDSFISRSTHYSFSAEMLTEMAHELPTETNTQGMHVDLGGRRDWYSLLVSNYVPDGNSIKCEEAAVFTAMRTQQTLIIENPPSDNSEFQRWLKEVQTFGRFPFEGKWISVSIPVLTQTNALSISQSDKISWNRPHGLSDHIYLNAYNFHQCFKNVVSSLDQRLHVTPGFFETCSPEKTLFVISGKISHDMWASALKEIDRVFKGVPFQFYLLPGASIESYKTEKAMSPLEISVTPESFLTQTNLHCCYMSNDTDALVYQLQALIKTKDGRAVSVIDINPGMSSSDLISQLSLSINEQGIIDARYTLGDLIKQICQSKKIIILKGLLSEDVYFALQAWIFEGKNLWVNGQLTSMGRGGLISVMPFEAKEKFTLLRYVSCHYNFQDYLQMLQCQHLEVALAVFNELGALFPHHGKGCPDTFKLNFLRTQNIVEGLVLSQTLHARNPLKSFLHFDYVKTTARYAYLCVMAKYALGAHSSSLVNWNKLISLMGSQSSEQFAAELRSDHLLTQETIWFFLNCFNAETIRSFLGDSPKDLISLDATRTPVLDKSVFEKVKSTLLRLLIFQIPDKEEKNDYEKSRTKLLKLIASQPAHPMICVKGESGVGKTTLIRSLKTHSVIYDFDHLNQWLSHDGQSVAILHIPEANRYQPHTFDFLKGMKRGEIFYDGKFHSTKNRVVIFEIKPESEVYTHYHDVMQFSSITLYLHRPSSAQLHDFLASLFQRIDPPLNTDLIRQKIIEACQLVDTFSFYKTSYFDIKNIALRAALLRKENRLDPLEAVYKAVLTEFKFSLPEENQEKFEEKLSLMILGYEFVSMDMSDGIVIRGTTTGEIYLPSTHRPLVDAIREDLRMQAVYLSFGVRNVLLEGDSGLGKSTLFKALFEEAGHVPLNTGVPGKEYCELNAGNKFSLKLLENAKVRRAAVILNEVNLDETLETKLIAMMTDETDPLRVYVSLNPSYFDERKALSPSFLSYFHRMTMPTYLDTALKEIAAHYGVQSTMVDAYRRCDKANVRTFFTALKMLTTKQSEYGGKRSPSDEMPQPAQKRISRG